MSILGILRRPWGIAGPVQSAAIYAEAEAEARSLRRRLEATQWRKAEATWQAIEAGVTRAEWAREIDCGPQHAGRLCRVWATYGGRAASHRPRFADAYLRASGK